MARLTWEYIHGGMFVDSEEVEQCELDDIDVHTGPAIIKLAEYEDTGLTPEEVKNLAITWQGKELNDHITELLTAEKQGLLHKAPAANGTKIFTILEKEYDDFFKEIYAPINEETYVHGYTEFVHGEVGKGFFLTKEDAENYIKSLSTTDAP